MKRNSLSVAAAAFDAGCAADIPRTCRARREALVKSKPDAPHAKRQPVRRYGALADRVYRPVSAGMKRGVQHFHV